MIINDLNDKKYIGVTSKPLKERFKYFGKGTNQSHYMSNIVKNLGKKHFDIIKLEENVSKEDVSQKEKYYIEKYNTLAPNGYNRSSGGIKNPTVSEEGIISLRNHNLGINNPKCSKYIVATDTYGSEHVFGSAREAARFLSDENKYRTILNRLRQKSTKEFCGYIWKYQ